MTRCLARAFFSFCVAHACSCAPQVDASTHLGDFDVRRPRQRIDAKASAEVHRYVCLCSYSLFAEVPSSPLRSLRSFSLFLHLGYLSLSCFIVLASTWLFAARSSVAVTCFPPTRSPPLFFLSRGLLCRSGVRVGAGPRLLALTPLLLLLAQSKKLLGVSLRDALTRAQDLGILPEATDAGALLRAKQPQKRGRAGTGRPGPAKSKRA